MAVVVGGEARQGRGGGGGAYRAQPERSDRLEEQLDGEEIGDVTHEAAGEG